MHTGIIKYWCNVKSYGLIEWRHRQYLVHYSHCDSGNPSYPNGYIGFERNDVVTFDINDQNMAIHVHYVKRNESLEKKTPVIPPQLPIPTLESSSDEETDTEYENPKTPNTNQSKPNKNKKRNPEDLKIRQPVFQTPPRNKKPVE